MAPVFAKVWAACTRGGYSGRTVTAKVKYADFQRITRSQSALAPLASAAELERIGLDLLRPCFPPPRGIRLLGVTVSNLAAPQAEASTAQLRLLLDPAG